MAAFLEEIEAFMGNGENNQEGKSLKEFLEEYDPGRYECPCVTTDIIVIRHPGGFQTVEWGLKLLMIKRLNHPGIGMWALPGGFAEIRENLIDSARRELKEETNLENIPMEQLYIWGNYDRDPRCRIITASFLALVEGDIEGMEAGDDAAEAAWMDVSFEKIAEEILPGKKRVRKEFSLILSNQEAGLTLKAGVSCTENQEGLLKEEEYKVESRDGIAFDHPCMIVQALRKLEACL